MVQNYLPPQTIEQISSAVSTYTQSATVAEWTTLTMLGTLFLTLLGFGIITLALDYHWRNYNIDTQKVFNLRLWYFSVAALLFGMMLAALLLYIL